jgi:hypothetical protein
MTRNLFFSFITVLFIVPSEAQSDSGYIYVHFLYGSKPAAKYRSVENKWFGGKLGGHVGIETDSNRVLHFLPSGGLHIIRHPLRPNSKFHLDDIKSFNSVFNNVPDSSKTLRIRIPVSSSQLSFLDSLQNSYCSTPPYDYAFIGMRCGSSTYEILAQLGILRPMGKGRTMMKIFYPRRLRKRLIRLAEDRNWQMTGKPGSIRRKWERD